MYSYKKKFGSNRKLSFPYDGNLRIDVTIRNNFTDNEADREFKYLTYLLNNISAIKEDPKYKDLGTPKIQLEFDIESAGFLIFEVAEALLNETTIIEIPDPPTNTKGPQFKRDLKSNKTYSKNTTDNSSTEDSEKTTDSKSEDFEENDDGTQKEY